MKIFFNKIKKQNMFRWNLEFRILNLEWVHSIFHIQHSIFRPRAFTLIETMVGIVIIVTAIIGPLSVAVTSATYAKDTKDKITAIYLAQEAADILRFERDSLLIKCNQNDSIVCPQNSLSSDYGIDSYETTSNAAWRIFKNNLNDKTPSGLGPSCFVDPVNGAGSGCTFDFYGFTKDKNQTSIVPPKKYDLSNTGCDYLYRDEAISGNSTGGAYLCNGSVANPLSSFKKTRFQRTVKLKSIKTVDVESNYLTDYNDDVRVNVVVNYGKPFGLVKSVEVVDFLHAKI